MKALKKFIYFASAVAPTLVFAASEVSTVPFSGNSDLDAKIKKCRDDIPEVQATKRGICAYKAYQDKGFGAYMDKGGCALKPSTESINKIDDCQDEIRKQSSAPAKAPAAAPLAVGASTTNNVLRDAPKDETNVPAQASVPPVQIAKANESNSWILALLGTLSVASIALGTVGWVRSRQLAVRLDATEKELQGQKKTDDDIKKDIFQTSNRVTNIEASLQSINTRLSLAEAASSVQAASQRQSPQRPAPPTVSASNDETIRRVGDALTAAVRAFVERNVSLSSTQALEQILKYVADEGVSVWMRAQNSEHHLIDTEGQATSNGQLLVIGVKNWNTWFVFPRPLSENIPRFSQWFDGDVSKRNVVASRPAIAAISQSGRFELKTKGALA